MLNTIKITNLAHRLLVAVAGLALAVAALQVTTPAAEASTSGSTCATTSTSKDWKGAMTKANAALATAQTSIANGRYNQAAQQLRTVTGQTQVANVAATALIGRPSTDPESDDVPGVNAVLKVSALDHRITMTLVPLFAGPHGVHVLPSLTKALLQADKCRDAMLGKVIALKPGKRDAYVDGLSDTLPVFKKELTAIANQLAGGTLTTGGRSALTQAQRVVQKTSDAMKKPFGGGERPAQ